MRWVGRRWRGSWWKGVEYDPAAQRIKRTVGEGEIIMRNLG